MRNDNVLKENVTQVSGKLQKSVIEVQQKYGDILNLPHHVSETHPPMPIADRAAQFAPFAALTGYKQSKRQSGWQRKKSSGNTSKGKKWKKNMVNLLTFKRLEGI